MFSIKPTEIQDANTGAHVAFGDYEADGRTCWMRLTVGAAITTLLFQRDGEVLRMIKHDPPPPPAEAPYVDPTSGLSDAEVEAKIAAEEKVLPVSHWDEKPKSDNAPSVYDLEPAPVDPPRPAS